MRRAAVLAAVATIALASGCGESSPNEERVGGVEVSGDGEDALGVGVELARELDRDCTRIEDLPLRAFARSLDTGPGSTTYREFYVRRYGSVLATQGALLKMCIALETIHVSEEEVLRIETSLGRHPADVRLAEEICFRLIRADIVDEEAEHRVLNAVGDSLRVCSDLI